LLNNIVSTQPDLNAGQILDLLHTQVRKTLRQESPEAEARDGMDIALCKIDYSKNTMSFAGAHRPLYYLKNNGEFLQFKSTLKAVGGIPRKNKIEPSFTNHDIVFESGDKFFIFTDGLPDQIGGPRRSKLKNKGVRELIINNKDKSIFDFYEILKQNFYSWKGDNKQIDDVLFIGVEF
jgi:serine phosphatase RsbU (regulator of sigma subunit)